MTKLSFFTLALLTGVGCAVVACSSDGDDTAAAGAGGKGGTSSSTGGKGGSSGKGGGTASEAGAGGEASTLFERLGGTKGITDAVDAIVAAEVEDQDIASYFSQSTTNPDYSPTVADIKGCLVLQFSSGSVSGGPETYPGKLKDGYQCRNMAATHADLGINSGTFEAFVTIAAGVLTSAGVADKDLGLLAGFLGETESSIVTDTASTKKRACEAPAPCAIGAGGAGGDGAGGEGGI